LPEKTPSGVYVLKNNQYFHLKNCDFLKIECKEINIESAA
jgi:hypothetical protein